MKRVNLDPNADFVGNRPPKPVNAQAIRKFSQRRPLIDIGDGDAPRGAEEAAEESRAPGHLGGEGTLSNRAPGEGAGERGWVTSPRQKDSGDSEMTSRELTEGIEDIIVHQCLEETLPSQIQIPGYAD